MAELTQKIGFIGGGNMAEAIVGALIRAGISTPAQLLAADVSPDRQAYLKSTYGIKAVADNSVIFRDCDVVVLAVKPQVIDDILSQLAGLLAENTPVDSKKLIISIAAGIPIQKIENHLYAATDAATAARLPIVRVMPNTPALVGAGMSGISFNRHVSAGDKTVAMTILAATGKVMEVNEAALNAVTAVSGSGPAYVFYLVEAMIEAGVSLGLTETEASTLTLETVKGAMQLIEERQESPQELRRKVTSPGGTTEAAITVLDNENVKEHIIAALTAACKRAHALSG